MALRRIPGIHDVHANEGPRSQSAIELSQLSAAKREEVFRDLAQRGLYPAAVGDQVQLCGGTGRIAGNAVSAVLIDGRPVATVGSPVTVKSNSDGHGCPSCPHPGIPAIVSGCPRVLINGRPIAVAGSETGFAGYGESGAGWVMEGRGELPGMRKRINRHQALAIRRQLVRGA